VRDTRGHAAEGVELFGLNQLQLCGEQLCLVPANFSKPPRAERNGDVRRDDEQDEKAARKE